MLVTSISPFPTVFSTLLRREIIRREIIISKTSFLPSANAFNFDRSNSLAFGKELSYDVVHRKIIVKKIRIEMKFAMNIMHVYITIQWS